MVKSEPKKKPQSGGFFQKFFRKPEKSQKEQRLTVQRSIPYLEMGRDGICRVEEHLYSKTVRFYDINYQLAQNEDKNTIFESWCDFLNYFDASIRFQLSFINHKSDMSEYNKVIQIEPQHDQFDDVRMEYAQMLKQQLAKGNNGLVRTKYITFSIEAKSVREAKPRLERIETDILNNFKVLGVKAYPLNGVERLQIMYETFHQEEQQKFDFSYDRILQSGMTTKDFIAPTSFLFKSGKDFMMGDTYGAASYLNILAPELTDKVLAEFLDMDKNLVVSIHVQSVDQLKAIKLIKGKITDLDRMKIEEQKKAVRSGYDMTPAEVNHARRQHNLPLENGAVEQPAPPKQEPINFHIEDNDLGAGGPKTKYKANVEAIRLLKTLDVEQRQATVEEQEILSRYVGWGGIPQAFDENNADWSKEYAELESLLTADEYKEARASTLNAFYTSPTVIKAMYEALGNMGLSKGNVLEPSCGVGNFMGLVPDSMEKIRMYGVELDSISGRIAQQLYQKNKIAVQGFETMQFPDSFFDCVVGNVPFGNYKVPDKRYDRHNFLIHDYFIAKSLDLVRPGGVVAVVTSSGKVVMGSVDFPLKGKVRCGNCRRVMAHNFKQAVPTFWCREGLELVGQTQCTSEVFQVSDIENAVFQELKKELSLLDSLYGDIQKEEQDLKDAHKKASRRKTLMEQELKNLKGEKMRMYEEYAAGTLPLDTYKQKKQECDRRISEVQEQIEQSKAEESAQSLVPGTVRAAAEQAENFLNGTRLTASMVSAFIENVFVYGGGRIVVRFKYEQSIQDAARALHKS